MADDQSRPSENQHQDAESEESEPRRGSLDSETDGEAESASDSGSKTRRASEDPKADETLDASETPDAEEAVDADAAEETVDSDAADAESSASDEEGMDEEGAGEEAVDEEGVNGEGTSGEDAPEGDSGADAPESDDSSAQQTVPDDVRKYERFKKMDGAQYDRVNEFLRERTYITAREWAIARLCADFRTETGVEMTKIGENLPELVPFMTDTYTPQAVNQARSSFEGKVRQAGATFLYGAMSGFFTAEELDDMMYEVTEVAKFLLEVEGVDLSVDEELEAEDRISGVMREVQSASEQLRHDEMECPNCGHEMEGADSAESDD